MRDAYILTLQNQRIIVRVKSNKDFDLSSLSTVDSNNQLFMEAIRQSPEHQMIEYEIGDLLSLTDFFSQVHLSKAQACCFLHDLIRAVGTALKNQPVLLDLDAILVSSRADQIYLLRAPLSFDCWMKREKDIDEFWQDLLEYLPCDNYEISGLLWKARKEKRSMEEVYHDLEELYQSSGKKKIFGKRQQVPTFQLSKPLVKQVCSQSLTIDHPISTTQQNELVQPLFHPMNVSSTNSMSDQMFKDANSSLFITSSRFDFGNEKEMPSQLNVSTDGYDQSLMHQTSPISVIKDQSRTDLQDMHFDFHNDLSNTGQFNFDQTFDSRNQWSPNPYEISQTKVSQSQRRDSGIQTDQTYNLPTYPQQQKGNGYVLNDHYFDKNSTRFSYTKSPDFNNQTSTYQTSTIESQRNETFEQRRNQTMQAIPNIRQNYPYSYIQNDYSFSANEPMNRYSDDDLQFNDREQWQYYDSIASNYSNPYEQLGFYSQPDYERLSSNLNLQDVAFKSPTTNYNSKSNSTGARKGNDNYSQNNSLQLLVQDQQEQPYSFIHEPVSDYQAIETIPPKQNECAHIDWNKQSFYLKGILCMAGRSEQCQVHIPDDSLSLQHARLSCDQGRWYIQDMKSCNGTWLNGKRIVRKMRLREGMMIRFGNCEAVFHDAPICKR